MAATATAESSSWSPEVLDLYEVNYDHLVRIVQRSTGCPDLAEDAVQDAFIKFSQTDCRPAPGKELAYLSSMAVNGARSVVRRDMRRAELVEQMPTKAAPPDIEDAVASRIEARAAEDVIESLPARQGLVMKLRYLVGLSERETAEAIGIAAGTVKIHASRGRGTVRLELETMMYGPR